MSGIYKDQWKSSLIFFLSSKAYLFDYENGEGLLIVGSSNFSFSALKTGYEWNLAMNAQAEPYTFQDAMDQFMEIFVSRCHAAADRGYDRAARRGVSA
ncbi:hypothetical protein GCM10007362_19430 [Saccharibacillus endophyticus]|uniref:Phospholipase D-like domain-containing protein n=1 Tax=Saccharibacillus endophyticus TaxID=2060666 RepID=A0ABQ1ZUE1_9BACL|nr:hypothetical protein GCM10007362_19430 [Saccharibacillus endophyticus]